MKSSLPSVALFACIVTPLFSTDLAKQSIYPVCNESEIIFLNGTWDFKYINSNEIPSEDRYFFRPDFAGDGWGKISVPSNWEMQGKAVPRYGRDLEEGVGLYRTTFSVPEAFRQERIVIRFEGVLYAYELFINGESAGTWESAFNSCQFDITPFLADQQENLLAVKVITHTERQTNMFDMGDSWSLSGIFRDVVLFSVPEIHFQDMTFRSSVLEDNSARVEIAAAISSFDQKQNQDLTLTIRLTDRDGIEAYAVNAPLHLADRPMDTVTVATVLRNPELWTAETPHLYDLGLTIYDGQRAIQSITEKVGIREISIRDGVFFLNNAPIKLKGACMHEIHPERGRALSHADRILDLQLAKKANINFIRTAHYPHHPDFFSLCDSMGFYVICEIPFNYSPPDVADNLNYLPDLLNRAGATISRYKNRPSIITWGIGNENRYAEIYKKVAVFAERNDPTRPRCFPQAPNDFGEEWRTLPDVFNVLDPHYMLPAQLDSLASDTPKPVIMTEYAHSLGLSTENLEENWEVVRRHPELAGGAIWMWSDQGIKRKRSIDEFLREERVEGVWADSTTFYDGFNEKGNDGIVYADRYPQADYWLARKVYSPIWVSEKKVLSSPGKGKVQIEFENRFDFLSLDGFHCDWAVKHYGRGLDHGRVAVSAPPGSTSKLEIPLSLPDLSPGEFTLSLTFNDRKENSVYETSVQILTEGNDINFRDLIRMTGGNKVHANRSPDGGLALTSKESLIKVNGDGRLIFVNRVRRDTLLEGFPVLRVGRKPTMTLAYQGKRYRNKGRFRENFYWDPYLLTKPVLLNGKVHKTETGDEIVLTYRWDRHEKENEYVEGDITLTMLESGEIACNYDLKPNNATGVFMESGLGFFLPERFTTFRWLGKGPFVSVPGKTTYNERDIWALEKDDIRFTGNRAETDLAAFYCHDTGIGFVGNKSNFGVESIGGRIVFSDNAIVSGFGSKVNFPKFTVAAETVASIKGSFDIVVLGPAASLFNKVFSPFDHKPPVEKPYLKSYGF